MKNGFFLHQRSSPFFKIVIVLHPETTRKKAKRLNYFVRSISEGERSTWKQNNA